MERYRHREAMALHAYVLLPNHVHLLLETSDRPLARTMQTLQFTYSQYYNRRYGRTGHVFEGRWQAHSLQSRRLSVGTGALPPSQSGSHTPPLSPWTYPWSSHAAYLGRLGPVVVSTSAVLGSLHRQEGPARQAYRRFIMDGLTQGHQARFYETVDQRVLGDERFVETVTSRAASTQALSARPRRVAFGPLLRAVATLHRMTPHAVLAPGRQRAPVPARAMLVFLAREWGALTTGELGRRLRRDPSMVSRLAAAYAAQRDAAVEAQVRRVLDSKIPE